MTRFMRFTPIAPPVDRVGDRSPFAAQMVEHLHPDTAAHVGKLLEASLKMWEGEGGIVVDLSPLPPPRS